MAALASFAMTFGGCSLLSGKIPEGQDPVRWAKNLGDYLNLRNSFLNPSDVGRFDKANPWGIAKPVTWPILEQLDGMEEPNLHFIGATDPLPSDLIVEQKEYVVGEGDYIAISVFELVTPGVPFSDQRQINEVGNVTIQNLGQVHVAGLTPTQIEEKIGQLAVEKGFLLPKGNGAPGPQVSVQLIQSRTRIFNVLGQVGGPGTYNIIGTDFRLLDALALARDVAGGSQPGMDYLYVIRPNKGAAVIKAPVTPNDPALPPTVPPSTPPATNPLNAIDRLRSSVEPAPRVAPPTADVATPKFLRPLPNPKEVLTLSDQPAEGDRQIAQAISPLDAAISGARPTTTPVAGTGPAAAEGPVIPPAPETQPSDLLNRATTAPPGMIWVDGKWVEVNSPQTPSMPKEQAIAAAAGLLPSRIIRIPINKLKEGETSYNIVIQPGDYIYVPNIEPGEFYFYGHVSRPGVYTLTGRKVTLKMALAAAGGLDSVAIPRRCDLVRRVGNTEVTIQVDLQRIFDGEQPDIYLKANDWINVGTDMIAPFLAVMRNAYRASYGWGYVYDRNLYTGNNSSNP